MKKVSDVAKVMEIFGNAPIATVTMLLEVAKGVVKRRASESGPDAQPVARRKRVKLADGIFEHPTE